MSEIYKVLTEDKTEDILSILEKRFDENPDRHKNILWADVRKRVIDNSKKLWSLNEMEKTGGEPDITGFDEKTGEYIYCDCSKESPTGRRNLCYDSKALEARKKNKPIGNAVDMAADMGIELLTEEQYRSLQETGDYDTKTSSWINTPDKIRKLGGALFCDKRYDHVFVYHNGADSYYSVRGFRGLLKV